MQKKLNDKYDVKNAKQKNLKNSGLQKKAVGSFIFYLTALKMELSPADKPADVLMIQRPLDIHIKLFPFLIWYLSGKMCWRGIHHVRSWICEPGG